MRKIPLLRPAFLLFTSALLMPMAGQAKPTVERNSTSNVVEVAALEPTAQRIKNLKLPPGFTISKFAEMYNPRMIAVRADGTIYISQRTPGTLVMLKDLNKDGHADVQKVVATRKVMHGIALRGDFLYFITIRELYRAPIKKDGTLGTAKLLIKDLPDAGQHPNRTIAFGPDGKLYISVGSTTNAANEYNEENATILVADADGKNRKVFASGLRNTIGFGWHPTTRRMIGWDHGIDTLGDNESKEEINEIKQGKRYGWPFIYEDGKFIAHPLPPAGYTREDWRDMSQNPLLMHTAHSAGIQMAFYTGKQFPSAYRNDAFIALRGSWNRNPPAGYQIARIHFDNAGRPISVTPFVDGFLLDNPTPKLRWGHFARVAGVAQHVDGSLLFSDDTNNIVYRVAYGAKNAAPPMMALDSPQIASDLAVAKKAKNTIVVKSSAFKSGGAIPTRFTAWGENVSPALRWYGVPKNAKSLVVMMEDPDSLSPKPFAHWLMANISPRAVGLKAGLPNAEKLSAVSGAMQGSNTTATTGYFGPKTPADGKAHHYNYQVFALDTRLNLPPGYNRQTLLNAMSGHVLAKGKLVGTYVRNPY